MTGPVLIINADDFGYDPNVTQGILAAMRSGVVTSTTFMVNLPGAEGAAVQAEGLAVGLHLNLARGAPVGRGFPGELLAEGLLVESRAGELPPEVVEAECLAQLDRLQSLLGRAATHVDVHKHLHRFSNVLEGLAAAARSRGLPVRSIDPSMRAELRARGVATNDHFVGEAGKTAYWTLEQLAANAAALPTSGVVEWMCHPGYAPSLVSGYSKQREVELATFVHPRAQALLASVERTDFRRLAQAAGQA